VRHVTDGLLETARNDRIRIGLALLEALLQGGPRGWQDENGGAAGGGLPHLTGTLPVDFQDDVPARGQFLLDMARLGDALLKVTDALRINYAILGNLEPALHAHVIPRYANEPAALRTAHPWAHDWQAAPLFDRPEYAELSESLRRELTRMGVAKPMRYDPGANAAC